MSLFGGDDSARSPSHSESEQSQASESSSPSVDGYSNPPSAQHPTSVQYTTESGEEDDLLADTESDSDKSDEELPTRPNRFIGPPAVWLSYTAADRHITTSLEQTQNKELAAHLYNAHALKRRVRRPAEDLAGLKDWQSRDYWLKRGTELDYADVSGEIQTELVPSKDWTAWPLRPSRIPTLHEQPRGYSRGERGEWRIDGRGSQDAGEEMREEMLATFLRVARERWNARDTEEVSARERDRMTQSRSRSRSKSARSARSNSRADARMKDDDDWQTDNAEPQDEHEHVTGRRRGRKLAPETSLEPAFLADDERAMGILLPAINSVLTKVDNLALAIRRTRLNHFGHGVDSDMSSQSDFTSGAESSEPSSRISSRAQSRSRTVGKQGTRPTSCGTSVKSHPKSLKARREAQGNPLGSDTDLGSDNSFQIENVNKAPVSRTPSRPRSSMNERTPSVGRDDTWRAGLMDWSEVLGLATVQGWNGRAVSRTAQRCAALFGESMSFVPFEEGLATKPTAVSVEYTPSSISSPDNLFRKGFHPSTRPYFQTGTLRCPHVECYGHENDFEAPYRVVQHCIRVHEYDPRTNDSDNEDRMIGGVHIDGFLQPIPAQRGWRERGQSRTDSRKRKREEQEHADTTDDAMIVESD